MGGEGAPQENRYRSKHEGMFQLGRMQKSFPWLVQNKSGLFVKLFVK